METSTNLDDSKDPDSLFSESSIVADGNVSMNASTADSSNLIQSSIRPPPPEKIKIHFLAVGNAPIMKKNKFMVNGNDQLHVVTGFLRKQLRLKETDSVFVFCNSAFAPNGDDLLTTLHECFHVNGTLVLNYSLTNAWG